MTKRIYFLLFMLAFSLTSVVAQDDNSAFTKTGIADEMTKDAENNKMWREGNATYSSAPRDAWELGVSLGHFTINGDVPQLLPSGFGVGLHVRNAINYVFSWRLEGLYSTSRGIDGRLADYKVLNLDNKATTLSQNTYRNFKTTNISGGISLFVNIGNLLFHKESNKWNFYVGGGLAITSANIEMNYLNGNEAYDWSAIEAEYGLDNSRDKRKAIWDAFDDSFETEADNDRNLPGINDQSNVFPSFLGTMGISRKINKRFNLSLEHQVFKQDYDKWDGHVYRSVADQSNDSDAAHYTSLRVGINLGNLDERTEPMYWLNPLDATMNDIADLKKRPVLDLTDTDGDGIIDMLDQEIDSKEGCPVDTRGIALDSDMDGFADCDDKEPYSPTGYEIDGSGVALVPAPLNEGDVNTIIDNRVPGMISAGLEDAGCGEWFLPMIHFDLDKYNIKPEFYSQLHHVANVLEICPNTCVSVVGHTDSRNSDDYNSVLSYNRAQAAIDYLVSNYGVDRSRFKLMYGGETSPLINNSNKEAQYYMNRRVEFRTCQPGDVEMGRPSGPNAGKGDRGVGSSYKGNKNSGY